MVPQKIFLELIRPLTTDEQLMRNLWMEIESAYNHKRRHYHTLTHLENLHRELTKYQEQIDDWQVVMFATFYHDLVYNILRQDNEEKSAERAVDVMRSLGIQNDKIFRCKEHILATKTHQLNADMDTNFFTDADLSILGKDWNTYSVYTRQVRKEFSYYPDLLYKPGRRKVLSHFLSMERIFKTQSFYDAYEAQARKNLMQELNESNQ